MRLDMIHDINVAVLCAAKNSVYVEFENVEVYDQTRDALTFTGGMPIVAHPPCRSWSAFLSHQSKPMAGERELGLKCCDFLRKCGGVLEQPAHSRLLRAAGLPLPGDGEKDGIWSVAVDQFWWGYPFKKSTWLTFSGVPREEVEIPYRLDDGRPHGHICIRMSKKQRSATVFSFAEFLLSAARKASKICDLT